MTSALFTNAPTQSSVGRLSLVGCDSSGVRLAPINPDWNCAQGPLDTTGYPLIETTQVIIGNNVCVSSEFINYTRNSGNGAVWQGIGGAFRWGKILNSVNTSVASGAISSSANFANCEVECSGTVFNEVFVSNNFNNVRVLGNPNATTGTRRGCATNQSSGPLFVFGCVTGVRAAGTTAATVLLAYRNTIVNCTTGIELATASSGGNACLTVFGCMIANCTTGVTQPFGRYELSNVRLRNTNNVSPANELPVSDVLTAAGSDADEFVDAAGGDYRIKSTSIYWGRRIGAGDQPLAGGGIMIPIGFRGGYNG